MEPETGAAAKEKDSGGHQNAPDTSSLTGKKADQDQQDIDYIKNLLARLSSGQEITPIKQNAEHEFGAKIEKLTDEIQKLKQTTEELAKVTEQKRELEKQNEELGKLWQEEKRESEEQIKKLKKRLQIQQEEKRESEEQIKHLKERLETNERRNFSEVWRPIGISTQRSTDDALEVEEPPKRKASGGQRFPMQALSASTGPGDKGKTVQKRRPIWSRLMHLLPLSARTRSGDEHETVKEDFSKPEPPYDSPRMTVSSLERLDLVPSPATGSTDVSTIPVKSDKDRRTCNITGMVAISGTQLILADDSNECIKLLDLKRGTVIAVKVLPSAPHDVTCVRGSRVAVTIPYLYQIHVFTADQNLIQCGIINVYGFCLGIHCSGDRVFVSCKYPPLVQILNMDGDIIKAIQLAPIEYPMYLTCSPDNKFIYVSDFYNDTVTCMDMAGSVQWTYNCKHSQSTVLTLPQGVCTGDGCIYICCFSEIHVVSPTGTKLAIIPFRMTGIKNAAICYSIQDRTLYLSPFPSFAEENTHVIRIRMH